MENFGIQLSRNSNLANVRYSRLWYHVKYGWGSYNEIKITHGPIASLTTSQNINGSVFFSFFGMGGGGAGGGRRNSVLILILDTITDNIIYLNYNSKTLSVNNANVILLNNFISMCKYFYAIKTRLHVHDNFEKVKITNTYTSCI